MKSWNKYHMIAIYIIVSSLLFLYSSTVKSANERQQILVLFEGNEASYSDFHIRKTLEEMALENNINIFFEGIEPSNQYLEYFMNRYADCEIDRIITIGEKAHQYYWEKIHMVEEFATIHINLHSFHNIASYIMKENHEYLIEPLQMKAFTKKIITIQKDLETVYFVTQNPDYIKLIEQAQSISEVEDKGIEVTENIAYKILMTEEEIITTLEKMDKQKEAIVVLSPKFMVKGNTIDIYVEQREMILPIYMLGNFTENTCILGSYYIEEKNLQKEIVHSIKGEEVENILLNTLKINYIQTEKLGIRLNKEKFEKEDIVIVHEPDMGKWVKKNTKVASYIMYGEFFFIVLLMITIVLVYINSRKEEKKYIVRLDIKNRKIEEMKTSTEKSLYDIEQQIHILRKKDEELRVSRERYRLTAAGVDVGIWDWDLEQNYVYLSEKAREVLGTHIGIGKMTKEEAFANILQADAYLVHNIFLQKVESDNTGDSYEIKVRVEDKEDKLTWIKIRGRGLKDEAGKVFRVAGSITNINKEVVYEAKINKLSFFDELTTLPNRTKFGQRIEDLITYYAKDPFALIYIDMDDFNTINDTLGHSYGDKVLRIVAETIAIHCDKNHQLYRFGGDEFIIIYREYKSIDEITKFVVSIFDSLKDEIQVESTKVSVHQSMGIAFYPADGADMETLLMHADMALNEAKKEGKNVYQFYSSELNKEIHTRIQIESELKRAIEENEFILYYQPKYNIKENRLTGYEALIRWNHPEKGILTPGYFVDIAEETGLIVEISDWVIEEAIQQVRRWVDQGYEDFSVAINLSGKQFKDENVVDKIKKTVAKYNVEPKYIEFEVTETIALFDVKYAKTLLLKLQEIGFKISLDDFGTGYSSLNYLSVLPIDILKIDKGFIQEIYSNEKGEKIIHAVINLAQAYNLQVVAEGVETKKQLAYLLAEGCDIIQGYYFSKPVPSHEAIEMFHKKIKRI